jgi:hypothetical protein
MDKYEIWFCDFPYDEQDGRSKKRPAVILDDGIYLVESLKLTSKTHDKTKEYEIGNYIGTGLSIIPTYIRIDKKFSFEKTKLITKIGKLDDKDIELLNERISLDKMETIDLSKKEEKTITEEETIKEESPPAIKKPKSSR